MSDGNEGAFSQSVYPSSLAARKRLQSVVLPDGGRLSVVGTLEGVGDSRNCCWKASTNDGPRWIRWKQDTGWQISKEAPRKGRSKSAPATQLPEQ